MTIYKVRISRSAMRDMDDLEDFLKSVMSQIGANKYIDKLGYENFLIEMM